MASSHGAAKEHRPDWPHAVVAWSVSPAGGVPLCRQRWDGNASENRGCKERGAAVRAQGTARASPRSRMADAQVATAAHAAQLACWPGMPRIPETWKVTPQVRAQAWAGGAWPRRAATTRAQRGALCHSGSAPPWLVVAAPEAGQRAQTPVANAQATAEEQGQTPLCLLPAQRWASAEAAHTAVDKRPSTRHAPQGARASVTPPLPSARPGRPPPEPPLPALRGPIPASGGPDPAPSTPRQQRQACCGLGPPIPATTWSAAAGIAGSPGPSAVDGGLRGLKASVFFVSSLFVNKPSRLPGLVRVLTLAFLVYAVAQRRMRNPWARPQEPWPNQSGPPPSRPTLRWIGQLLEGINRVTLAVHGHVAMCIAGLTDLRRKILQLFGQKVCQIYQISPG